MRLFSAEHLALLEISSKQGKVTYSRYNNYSLPESTPRPVYANEWSCSHLYNSGFITKTEIEYHVYEAKITDAGKEELKKQADPKARRYRFSISDYAFERKFWYVVAGVEGYYTEFDKICLLAHNGIDMQGKLTKASEKWVTRNLAKFINSRLPTAGSYWDVKWGPNKAFWLQNEQDFSDWKTTLTWDYNLLRAVPGVATVILPELKSEALEYAKLLLSSPTFEKLIEKIKNYQKQHPESFPFCPISLI